MSAASTIPAGVSGRLRALANRLDAQTRRERLLLAAAVAVVLLLAWDLALRTPLAQRHAVALDRIERLRVDIERLESTTRQLSAELDADAGEDRTVATIEDRIARVDKRLAERTARVVSPEQMARVLRDVLAADDRLDLVALENTDVEPVMTEGTGDAAAPQIYRHRVEVVIEGRYFALLDYIERLEALRWRFQWDTLRVETVEYPTARATLSLSTLSLAEAWIGV